MEEGWSVDCVINPLYLFHNNNSLVVVVVEEQNHAYCYEVVMWLIWKRSMLIDTDEVNAIVIHTR